MAAVGTSGSTRATPSPRSGQTAPNRCAEAKPCCRTPRGRTPFWYQTCVRRPFCPILAGLVHEPELDPFAGVPARDLLDQTGQVFLNRSCALGSASGWTGRAFCHERSSPLSSRSIPLSR